jgi:hypothetical protein
MKDTNEVDHYANDPEVDVLGFVRFEIEAGVAMAAITDIYTVASAKFDN